MHFFYFARADGYDAGVASWFIRAIDVIGSVAESDDPRLAARALTAFEQEREDWNSTCAPARLGGICV